MKRILLTGLALALSSGIAFAQTATNGPANYNTSTAPAADYRAGATQHSSTMPFSQSAYGTTRVTNGMAKTAPRMSSAPFDQMQDGSMEGGGS